MNSTNLNITGKRRYVIILSYIVILIVLLAINAPLYCYLLAFIFLTALFIAKYYSSFLGYWGNIYYSSGKTEKSKKLYQKAIEKNSINPTVYLNYGVLLVKAEKPSEALQYFNKAKELKPNSLTLKNILLTMGSCYWKIGNLEMAIETLEYLLSNYTNVNNAAFVTLGYVYLLKGDLKNALKYSEIALENAPENGSAWDNLGQISFYEKDYEAAKKHFKKAIECNNQLADSYYYLGLIFEEEEHWENAKKCFEMANSCVVTALNTVTKEDILNKYEKYV